MVLIKLLSKDINSARYAYQPEKQGEEGILNYNFKDDEMTMEKMAEKDLKSGFYRNHIYDELTNGGAAKLTDTKTIAWY